ncbi:MAG: hypothetical protein GXP62_17515 [Oligoflexia bacterium]|nr:hypothetical protein [Oligoflexia bacterium]
MLLTLLASLTLPAWAGLSQLDAQAILLIESQRLPPMALETYVEDPDPQTRARAARALGRLRETSAVIGLERLAQDPEITVRREAAFALGQTPNSLAVVVRRLAEETDPDTRAALVCALGKQGDAQVIPMLLDALTSSGEGLRGSPEPAAAARAIGRLSMREVVDVRTPLVAERLLAMLHRIGRDTRQGAAFALSRLSLKTLEDPTRDRLLDAATGDRDPVVRAFLVRAAAGLDLRPPETQALLAVANTDPSPGVRVAAARAAAKLDFAGVSDLLEDENPGVRRAAITAVGAIDSLDPTALLQPIIDAGLSLEAAEALRTDGDPRLLDAATAIHTLAANDLLEDPETFLSTDQPTRVRQAAVAGLKDLDRLVELATQDDENIVRTQAASRLAEISTDPQQLVPLLDARDRIVASIAADYLSTHPLPHIEGKLVELLKEDHQPDLLRAAAQALAARYQGHPAPPIARDADLRATLKRLAVHPDASVRAAIATLDDALGLDPVSTVHNLITVPLDQVGRIQGARIFTSRGEVRIDLLPDEAPLTVWNFASLADQGFYDNLAIHRVVPDFVVQDGDPRGDGYGGPGWTIPDEINPIPYDTGVVGMALSGPDTGGSQWFVTLSPQPHLDGGYTVFGRVSYGMGLLKTLQPGDRIRHIEIERSAGGGD